VSEIRQNQSLPEWLRQEISTAEGLLKLKRIGSIICDIGTLYFGEYDTTPWSDMPDALKIYFDNSLLKWSPTSCNGDECNLDQLILAFEGYQNRLATLTFGWDLTNVTDWRGMMIMLRGYENADFAFLSARERFTAILALSNNIDCDVWSREPCYGTDEYNEKSIVRLIKYQSPDPAQTCEFIGLLLNSGGLLNDLFDGMSDVSFFEGGKDEYFDFIESLMTLISSSDCSVVENLERQTITKAINLGFFKSPWIPMIGGYCDIRIEGDCFNEMTINWPIPFPVGANASGPILTYGCIYSNPFGLTDSDDISITVEGPLDYVPINVISDDYAAGMLPKGLHLVPSFLLCFLRDYSVNLTTRQRVSNVVNAAIIAVSIPATVGTGGVTVPAALRLIGAIDAVGAVVFTEVNFQIETGQIRGYYVVGEDGTREYNKFVNGYRQVEQVYNSVMINATVFEFASAAARGLARAVSKMNPPSNGTGLQLPDRVVALQENSRAFLFADLPSIESLLQRFPDSDDIIRQKIVSFEEEMILALDRDLLTHSSLGDVLVNTTGGFTSYQVLSAMPPSNTWRVDPDIIRQLAEDMEASAPLKANLLADGPDGALAWKLIDDNMPTPIWCATN
jgi:hypothetical protein